ncbi:hypothetical protein SAMN05216361_0017 [Marisediminitalea aggregata]|uniref:Uncharacterized protein n=1 Tax=Marisediminitalea aggregata TaxID=634436 RepID=A0A1M5SL63_9ALTE|nr:hypothetical protein [Marisediminitalea aggregata]SHH39274.1 hypothetical protein SAMN05216361_0017 [Marisediminitalea aggregata]
MTPYVFTGFFPSSKRVGVVLERITNWEHKSSLGYGGTEITLDSGETILVGETPNQVTKILEETLKKAEGEIA